MNLTELRKYRALIWALVVRHLSIRYRGSVLGFLWSFLNPLLLMLVYVLVFKYYIRFNEVPNYTLFLFCGLLPWLWISSGLIEGTASIVSGGHLITKSMFPAHILPIVAVLGAMINFILSLPLLLGFVLYFGVDLQWSLLTLPLLMLLQFLFLMGLSLALASLNVQFRDVQHLLANLLSLLFFLCPIVYPATVVPEKLSFTMQYNPFAVLTVAYQNIVLDGIFPSSFALGYLSLCAIITLALGELVYRHYRERFAELL